MELPTIPAMANGITATMIIITAYAIGFRLLVEMRTSESKLLPWQALFAFSLGSFYLGTSISFWLLIFTGSNIQPLELGAILCYSITPIGMASVMYIGFSMIRPKFAKPMAWIYLLLGIPFWANLWFDWPESGKSVPLPPAGEVIDIELLSISSLYTTFSILSMMLVLGGGFIYLARLSSGEIKHRATLYAAGIIIFCLCGIVDSRIPLQQMGLDYIMVVVRIIMLFAYIILYKAMIPPKSQFPPAK